MRDRAWDGSRCHRTAMAAVLLWLTVAAVPARAVDLIGYLPHYRMNASYNANVLPDQLALLDEIRYFGLTINSSGAITPLGGSGTLATHHSIASPRSNRRSRALPADDRPRLNITFGGAGEAAATPPSRPVQRLALTLATNVDVAARHHRCDIGRYRLGASQRRDAAQQLLVDGPADQARGRTASGAVYATMTPEIFMPASAFQGANAIDGVSLMTYDLGWWGNDPANPLQGEHSVPEYVEDSVEAWTEPAGSPNDRPWVFGSWGNNMPAEHARRGSAILRQEVSTSSTAYTYAEMVAGGTTTTATTTTTPVKRSGFPVRPWSSSASSMPTIMASRTSSFGKSARICIRTIPTRCCDAPTKRIRVLIPVPVPGDYDGNGVRGRGGLRSVEVDVRRDQRRHACRRE